MVYCNSSVQKVCPAFPHILSLVTIIALFFLEMWQLPCLCFRVNANMHSCVTHVLNHRYSREMHLWQSEIITPPCRHLTLEPHPLSQAHTPHTSTRHSSCHIPAVFNFLEKKYNEKWHRGGGKDTMQQATFRLITTTNLNENAAENNTTDCSWQSLGTSSLFLFSLRCTAVCHNIASFPMKTSKCHTVTSPLAPWPPAGILCQRDKQSLDTFQPLSEQKNHRKRSGTCHISLPRNYSAPYVSGWG